MEDKHNVILILLSSSGFISSFQRFFILSHSRFKVFSSFIFRSSKLLADFVANLHPNHRKDLILSLSSLNFTSSFFCYRSSSRWFVKDLIHVFKFSSRFLWRVQLSFLLASRSANNSTYSFALESCIYSFSLIFKYLVVAQFHLKF